MAEKDTPEGVKPWGSAALWKRCLKAEQENERLKESTACPVCKSQVNYVENLETERETLKAEVAEVKGWHKQIVKERDYQQETERTLKAEVTKLTSRNKAFYADNASLHDYRRRVEIERDTLKAEIVRLNSVLANSTAAGGVIKDLQQKIAEAVAFAKQYGVTQIADILTNE